MEQVAAHVAIAVDSAINFDDAQRLQGELREERDRLRLLLEVNNLLVSMQLLANASKVFATKCVDGLEANEERCEELAQKSLSLATVLNPLIGYEKAAELVKEAFKKKVGVKQLALEKKLITPEQAEKAFDLRKMTEPGETVGGGGG